jgi:hypothetical protein
VPDDVGGQPFPDGDEPEFHHGGADDEFASVVLDEDFVRSAEVHEPTAVERILSAAQSHAESEPSRGLDEVYGHGPGDDGELEPDGVDDDPDDDEGRFDRSDYTAYAEYAEYAEGEDEGPDAETYGPGHLPFGLQHSDGPSPYRGYGLRTGPYATDHAGEFVPSRPGYDLGDEHGSDYGFFYGAGGPAARPPRGQFRWQRPVAWVLAVVMGIGMVALAVSAVYRSDPSGQQRQKPAPAPSSTEDGGGRPTAVGAGSGDS